MNKILEFIKRNKLFTLQLFVLLIIILIVVFANQISPYGVYEGNLRNAFLAPSESHPLGTDKLGRDVLTRIIYAIRISLTASLSLVLVICVIGSSLGFIAAYFGGILDKIIMRISDILISCPSMVLAIALAGIMGASLRNALIALFVVTVR